MLEIYTYVFPFFFLLERKNRKNKMLAIGSTILKENSFGLYDIFSFELLFQKKNIIFLKFN
jgi:hypothetical protein